ncbi:MAG: transcriptional regulator [bacterium]|jgi:predicted transcriptional regulator with HTH domain
MIDQLFGSKTRVKLLQLFYSNPNRSFYVREITRKIDEQINSVRRELANLLTIGIIVSRNDNNKLFYEVNKKFEYNRALSEIFSKAPSLKTSELDSEGVVIIDQGNIFKGVGNVELAFYTGQFTNDEISGIDLMIVGDVNKNKLDKFILELESQENKEIRYVVMDLEEYKYRNQVKDKFISDIKSAKKQVLVDKNGILISEE